MHIVTVKQQLIYAYCTNVDKKNLGNKSTGRPYYTGARNQNHLKSFHVRYTYQLLGK